MSGFNGNDWDKYLNGGSTNYNFSYNQNTPPPQLLPHPMNTTPLPSPPNSTIVQTGKQLNTPFAINTKKHRGGKRKSKRQTKKYRRTHRK